MIIMIYIFKWLAFSSGILIIAEVILMSKDLTNTSDLGKTMGEQSGSAKSHLDAVLVSADICSKFTQKPIKFMKYSAKT